MTQNKGLDDMHRTHISALIIPDWETCLQEAVKNGNKTKLRKLARRTKHNQLEMQTWTWDSDASVNLTSSSDDSSVS